jgi:hypothetical protein
MLVVAEVEAVIQVEMVENQLEEMVVGECQVHHPVLQMVVKTQVGVVMAKEVVQILEQVEEV